MFAVNAVSWEGSFFAAAMQYSAKDFRICTGGLGCSLVKLSSGLSSRESFQL